MSSPSQRALLIVILAAGKGTRMKSSLPKVLHKLAGLSLVGHVMAAARSAGATRLAVVVGPDMPQLRAEVTRLSPQAEIFEQAHQLGTADALRAAQAALADHTGDVLVLFGDTPLIEPATLLAMRASLDAGAHVTVLGFRAADPTGYGRLILDADGGLSAIREHKEASAAELALTFCNAGVMGFRGEHLLDMLARIGNANAKGEYYLTDAVEIARARGLATGTVVGAEAEVLGVNARDQLAIAEGIVQARLRARAMRDGATLIDPQTVYFCHDTRIGRDVVIEPGVVFGPGVSVEDNAEIKAYSHIEGARIGKGVRVGPFARLRPGADLADNVHIGNFVEVKNVRLDAGAKANHLAYLGDGHVGADANIGAGTIFCNYDGFTKHRTEVGAGAFIGSNAALVAPVRIGAGAYVGSGSVITRDVAADALAIERSRQEERPGWAAKFRELMRRRRKVG